MHTLDHPDRQGLAEPQPFGPIALATGLGEGPTPLAAFDAALCDAGVANYNLICLSSVIPPGSVIERRKWVTPREDWGRRLYCVVSQMREERPGHSAHAGIGYVRDEGSGAGLFVELHDASREQLDADLRATLRSMQAGRGTDTARSRPRSRASLAARCQSAR